MKRTGAGNLVMCLAAAILLAGCATQRVDWNSRIGHYTFDQAVAELGPPDKQAKLSDGRTVTEWITRYYHAGSAVAGAGYYGGPHGSGVIQTPPNYYESHLRLIFGTNQVLSAWSKE